MAFATTPRATHPHRNAATSSQPGVLAGVAPGAKLGVQPGLRNRIQHGIELAAKRHFAVDIEATSRPRAQGADIVCAAHPGLDRVDNGSAVRRIGVPLIERVHA